MEKALESSQKKEETTPIMMDDEHTREIIGSAGVMRCRQPYQYKMNSKKRVVADREGLDNDEEEVEDLHATENIEDIFHATYERKNRGHGSDDKEGSPFQILIILESTTPCVTTTT
jgi:hypothetical protein